MDALIAGLRGAGLLLLLLGLAYVVVYLPQKWSGLYN
jgi:hypothetical protein